MPGVVYGDPMQFECTTEQAGDTVVVRPSGEVDRETADAFRDAMLEAVAEPGARHVEVDLTGISFLDSSGVGALLVAHRAADTDGRTLVVRDPVPHVRMVLEITNVARLLGL